MDAAALVVEKSSGSGHGVWQTQTALPRSRGTRSVWRRGRVPSQCRPARRAWPRGGCGGSGVCHGRSASALHPTVAQRETPAAGGSPAPSRRPPPATVAIGRNGGGSGTKLGFELRSAFKSPALASKDRTTFLWTSQISPRSPRSFRLAVCRTTSRAHHLHTGRGGTGSCNWGSAPPCLHRCPLSRPCPHAHLPLRWPARDREVAAAARWLPPAALHSAPRPCVGSSLPLSPTCVSSPGPPTAIAGPPAYPEVAATGSPPLATSAPASGRWTEGV